MNKQVSILTTFADLQRAYSLNIIVQTQIKMLLLNGYTPTVIVHETFKPEGIYAHPKVKIVHIPNVPCYNEVKLDDTFDEDVKALEDRLYEILKDQDIVLTHDIIYQPACLKHNFASRRVAQRLPKLRWLHWIHSATSPGLLNMVRPIFRDEYSNLMMKPFPNAFLIYPNSYAIPAVAKNFNTDEQLVKYVPHATDICGFYNFPSEVEQVVYEKDLLSADAMTTYPIRLDRGKQVEFVIRTMAGLKSLGLKTRTVIMDFHSTGGDKVEYRDWLKQQAIDSGMSQDEVIFISEQHELWRTEVDPSIVMNFQLLSNVFIMPSVSETYSLVAQEAALTGQVVVLNYDFPPFRSIYGDFPIYRKYSSAFDVLADPSEAVRTDSWTGTKYGAENLPEEARKSAEQQYHLETAKMIYARLQHPEMALATFLKQKRNLNYVFKHHLEPLFYS